MKGTWEAAKAHCVTSLSRAKSHNSSEQPCPRLHMPALSEQREKRKHQFPFPPCSVNAPPQILRTLHSTFNVSFKLIVVFLQNNLYKVLQ